MYFFFFFNDTATTEIYTLSLHDALPISRYAPGAVLRLGLCLRCDPALPPAAGPLEHQRSFGDAVPVTGGVVGVGLHGLVHQLVRPRSAAGSPEIGRASCRGRG